MDSIPRPPPAKRARHAPPAAAIASPLTALVRSHKLLVAAELGGMLARREVARVSMTSRVLLGASNATRGVWARGAGYYAADVGAVERDARIWVTVGSRGCSTSAPTTRHYP